MSPQEYLILTQDLRATLDADLLPLQENLRQTILESENRYAKDCNTEPLACKKARSALADSHVAEMMVAYIYKWAAQSAEKQLDISILEAELLYTQRSLPIILMFEEAVEDRIQCKIHS